MERRKSYLRPFRQRGTNAIVATVPQHVNASAVRPCVLAEVATSPTKAYAQRIATTVVRSASAQARTSNSAPRLLDARTPKTMGLRSMARRPTD